MRFLLSSWIIVCVPVANSAEPTFAVEGVAFLKKHCLACHGTEKPKADLSLISFTTDASLLAKRKIFTQVISQVESGEMPPKQKPQPSADERALFLKVVEKSYTTAAKNAKPDPGRVTVRRLNRVEYDNTIRDLFNNLDFDPSTDFPSDDVGHGFDNIGDVLTISPVLMERYLAAAEAVSERAIVVNPPKPPARYQSGRYLEPASKDVPQTRFRPLVKGELHTPFRLEADGEYIIKIRAYATGEGPVQAALQIDQKDVFTFEVKPGKPEHANEYHKLLTVSKGKHRFGVMIQNPSDAGVKEPRTLHVEYVSSVGPTDTRPSCQAKLIACDATKSKAEQLREIAKRFADRAWRRPTTPTELDRLVALMSAVEATQPREVAVQRLIQAVLCSPKFLFRLELDDRPDSADAHAIDEYQLASRLSYFLWSTMPDDTLLRLAAEKSLSKQLPAQVKRMLADPKAIALSKNFAQQWLQLRPLANFAPDAKLFPQFQPSLRADMLTEAELFFMAILQEDRSILDLIDGKFGFVSERLATFYGIADTKGTAIGTKKSLSGGSPIKGEAFVRVSYPADSPRGGILTMGAVLAVTSNATRTSPVKRGKWVLEQLLGESPPPAPPDIPALPADERAMAEAPLRKRMEQHRANAACANCHAKMDPIGFAFENFNAIGAFRTTDGMFPIDASGTLPDGKMFNGPTELKAILRERASAFRECLTEKMLTYALGRGLEFYDQPAVDRITTALAKDGDRFSVLVCEIVQSRPFRERRGKEQNR